MANTVNAAFDEFLTETVNLDSDRTSIARKSRDWLVQQINSFPHNDETFPYLYDEKHVSFGSFARRTKIRPLDDIDMMTCLRADGCTYTETTHDQITISVPESSRLYGLTQDTSDLLNSRKVINKIAGALSSVPHYSSAAINRRGEAATLKLASYEWNFDIVPSFFTAPQDDGRSYYVIPNGEGNWKKTDPLADRERLGRINGDHNGHVLNVIRIIKYWQRRKTMPTMGSYLLECMVASLYDGDTNFALSWVDLEIPKVLRHVASGVFQPVEDPKGIQGDLNDLSLADRYSIRERAIYDADRSDEARQFEKDKDHESALRIWGAIFGDEFPSYG